VSDINEDCRKRDLERLFGKYGSIKDIWIATYAPFYAFVGYKDRRDADEGQRKCDGASLGSGGKRIRVAHARPRMGRR